MLQLTPAEMRTLEDVYGVLKRLADLDPGMTVHRALFYLYVARNPGCFQAEAGDAIGASISARSKHAMILSSRGGPQGERPLGLLNILPMASRDGGNQLELTGKGQAFLKTLLSHSRGD